MAWIEQRGRRFRVVWREGGERVGIVCATKTEARAVKAQIEADQVRGVYVDPRAGRITVREWSQVWLAARSGVKDSSDYADRGRLRNHILPTFGDLRLEQVTPLTVRSWVRTLETQLAAKTVRNCHGLLHTMMRDAVNERLIPRNPCHRTGLPPVTTPEMLFLTTEQLDALITETPEHYQPLIVLLATTGLRWGEATGLLRKRVSVTQRQLDVRVTLSDANGRLELTTPKTRRAVRTVSLSDGCLARIEPLLDGNGDAYIFTTPRGRPLRRNNFNGDVWKTLVERAGMPAGLRVHDLRHTHAAHLISAGVPLPAISRRLGHASIKVTIDVYGHLLPEVDERLLAVVDGMLAPVVPTLAVEDDRRPEAV